VSDSGVGLTWQFFFFCHTKYHLEFTMSGWGNPFYDSGVQVVQVKRYTLVLPPNCRSYRVTLVFFAEAILLGSQCVRE